MIEGPHLTRPDKTKLFPSLVEMPNWRLSHKNRKVKALAKRFMAYRAAKQAAEDPPVDLFCRRGDSRPRFAYFD